MPKIEVMIEGKPVEAWIDLGRSIALFEEDKFSKGALVPTGAIVTTQGFNDVVKRQQEVELSTLQVGGYSFIHIKGTMGTNAITAYSITPNQTSMVSHLAPPVMLGNEIFNKGVLLVDYKRGFFEYGQDLSEFKNEVPFQKWAHVPFQLDRGQIQFLGLAKGLSGHWILDSGSTVNLIYKISTGPLKFTAAETQAFHLGNVSFLLDNLYYTNKPLKAGIFGILGAPFIKSTRILIDFRKKQLYIEPKEIH